jgi:hypothetical protein
MSASMSQKSPSISISAARQLLIESDCHPPHVTEQAQLLSIPPHNLLALYYQPRDILRALPPNRRPAALCP